MPTRPARRQSDTPLRIGVQQDGSGGLGSLGVDLVTHDTALSVLALRQGDRVRAYDGALTPAPGPKRLKVFTPAGRSRTFADTAKYATIPAAAQLLLPMGGFAVHFSMTAVRGGTAGQILHGQDGLDSTPPFDFSLSAAGALSCKVTMDGGGSETITSGVLANGSTNHVWFIFDQVAATVTLYVNGSSVGTPSTGIGAGKRPVQTASMAWIVGVQRSAAGVNTLPFMGKIDALQVRVLRGVQAAQGSPSLVSTLLAHSYRQWPNPAEPSIVAQYDFDEASGTSMLDRSKFKNHGTYTGAPTADTAVAYSFPVGNHVGVFQGADGSRTNLVGVGGALFYEIVKAGG